MIKGDAADEQTIQDLVSCAVKEEGHLDVFFANVSLYLHLTLKPPPYILSIESTGGDGFLGRNQFAKTVCG